jgi:hypothetical protein
MIRARSSGSPEPQMMRKSGWRRGLPTGSATTRMDGVGSNLRIDVRWGQDDVALEGKYAAELVQLSS